MIETTKRLIDAAEIPDSKRQSMKESLASDGGKENATRIAREIQGETGPKSGLPMKNKRMNTFLSR